MAIESKAEALAFIEAMQLTVKGKKGFSWLYEELSDLRAYLDRVIDESAEAASTEPS